MKSGEFKPEVNLGGCLGFLLGGTWAIAAFVMFPLPGFGSKAGWFAAIFLTPYLLPLFVGGPIGNWIWKLAFPQISAKKNELVVSCVFIAMFAIVAICVILILLFAGDINRFLKQR